MKTLMGILWVGVMISMLGIAVQPFYLTGNMIINNPKILLRCPNFWAIIILTIMYWFTIKWSVQDE